MEPVVEPLAAPILVVDDEPANLRLLERILDRAGYSAVYPTADPRQVVELCAKVSPDLILLDLQMPHLDGFQVMEQLRELYASDGSDPPPILVLTADARAETRHKALGAGAKDFLTKPFDHTETLLRIGNLLETRLLHLELKGYSRTLEEKVRDRTADLWDSVRSLELAKHDLLVAQEETIKRLSIAGEFRDDDTGKHVGRMSRYCRSLAEGVGENSERCRMIELASRMHDIGKIGIPDSILKKPTTLTGEERSIIERHASIGNRILSGSGAELLDLAAVIALTHHERFDGKGYPHGIRGEEIPIEGRIAAIADVFDALISDRVYRPAFSLIQAIEMMKEGRGSQFDPAVLDTFLTLIPELLEIKDAVEAM